MDNKFGHFGTQEYPEIQKINDKRLDKEWTDMMKKTKSDTESI